MKSSWRIGRIAGIDVHLHFTFVLLLGWVALSHYLPRRSWEDALIGLAFTLALFTIVVLHELGHALTALRFGIRTRDILLLPIGGVARMERIPDKPRQELLVALAGPAVNAVLATLFGGILLVSAEWSSAIDFRLVGSPFLAKLMWVNVSLALFNLLPAFPMDGGRVLRAVLAMRMNYVRATNIAASIGQGMAWVFGFLGLFTNPFLIFIALFVRLGAAQEAGQAQMKSALANTPVSRVMMTEFSTLAPDDRLSRAVEHVLGGYQQDFPVVEGGRVVGILTRTDLLAGLAKGGQHAPVADVMQRAFCTIEADEMMEEALSRLQEGECKVFPVTHAGGLAGLITLENIGEYLLIRDALDKANRNVRNGGESSAVPQKLRTTLAPPS